MYMKTITIITISHDILLRLTISLHISQDILVPQDGIQTKLTTLNRSVTFSFEGSRVPKVRSDVLLTPMHCFLLSPREMHILSITVQGWVGLVYIHSYVHAHTHGYIHIYLTRLPVWLPSPTLQPLQVLNHLSPKHTRTLTQTYK